MIAAASDWSGVHGSRALLAVITLAALGTVVVFALSLAAYYRRRETSYLLISLAVGALLVRSAVGFGTVRGDVPMLYHHLVEHTLDFLIAVLVLCAAYVGGAKRSET